MPGQKSGHFMRIIYFFSRGVAQMKGVLAGQTGGCWFASFAAPVIINSKEDRV